MQLWVIDAIQSAIPEGLSPTEKQGGSALESDHQKDASDAPWLSFLSIGIAGLCKCLRF